MSWLDNLIDTWKGAGQLAGEGLDSLGWALGRPQQSIFQGARAGADAFGNYQADVSPQQAALEDQVYNSGWPGALASNAVGAARGITNLARSIPSFLGGMVSDPDQTMAGKDLTEGMTGTPRWDNAMGTYLDLTADPWSAIPGMNSQTMGTMARTGKNMARMAWDEMPQFQKIENYGLWNSLKNLDISAPARAADSSSMIIRDSSSNVLPLARDLGYYNKEIGSRNALGMASAAQDPNAIFLGAASPEKMQQVAWHEGSHIVNRDPVHWTEVAPAMAELARQNPNAVAKLQNMGYNFSSSARAGSELLARLAERGPDQVFLNQWASPLNGVMNRTLDYIPNGATQAANPVNLTGMFPDMGNMNRINQMIQNIFDMYREESR